MFLGFNIIFLLFLAIFSINIAKGLKQWNINNNSPRLTAYATVLTKRTDVHHHNHANAADISGMNGYHSSSSTTYYVTFELESGERMEFNVKGNQYGMLVEDDIGKLSYQGTRFLDFKR